jgi:hypothetical protein
MYERICRHFFGTLNNTDPLFYPKAEDHHVSTIFERHMSIKRMYEQSVKKSNLALVTNKIIKGP